MYQPLLVGRKDYCINIRTMHIFTEHWHSEIEIIYCVKGYIDVKLDGTRERVGAGCAVFIGSGVVHEIVECDPNGEMLVIEMGVSFLGINYTKLSELEFLSAVVDISKNDAFGIGELFVRLTEIQCRGLSNDTPWEEMGLLFLLADAMLKKIPNRRHISAAKKQRLKKISIIQPVIKYVEQNYMNNITVAEAAEVVGYETNYFGKCFKEAVGISFHNYLNRYRIILAQNIMSADNTVISKIGEMVGIPDPKTFSRIFKEKTGKTPSEYRKSVNKNIVK